MMTISDESRVQAALEQLDRDDLQALILRMVQQHPDLAGLIVSGKKRAVKKPREPFNAEVYRLQVEKIFLTTDRDRWGSEARAAEPLLNIVDVADEYVEQEDFNEAATMYEIVIRGILDNYDSFRWHADEGQLDEVVEDCVDGLSDCLRGMQQATAVRKKILKTLFDVYDLDMSLENDMPVMSSKVPAILVRYTTPEEQRLVAKWVRKGFDLDIDWQTYEVEDYAQSFEVLLLGLEGNDLDDETFLRLAREMESYEYIVDRLLKRGRLEEALAEAKQVDDFDILEIADILGEHGYEDEAVQLIKERADQSSHTDLLHWLQERYEAGGNPEAALEIAKRTFTTNFIDGLDSCFAGEGDNQEMRLRDLRTLFAIYRFYTDSGMDLDEDIPGLLLGNTSPKERQVIAGWVRDALKQMANWNSSERYETLLVTLERINKR